MAYINYVKVSDWTKHSVRVMLETNDAWTEKAIVALYNRQTRLEQQHGTTRDLNRVGFQVADSEDFGKFARKILSGNRLSESELAYCRRPWGRGADKTMPTIAKYRGQILDMIDSALARKGVSQ